MKISSRLQAIADLIEEKTIVDIGCDHALLDIYCVKEKHLTCIAADVNQNAYEIAKKNIQKYGLEDQIQLYLTDGANGIPFKKDSTLVIAGMGTSTMIHILEEMKELPNQLILQTNNHLKELRMYLVSRGYFIEKEILVKEKHIFNVILSCKKGTRDYQELDYELGPIIRNCKKKIEKEYLSFLIQNEKKVLSSLTKNQEEYSIHEAKLKQYENELTK